MPAISFSAIAVCKGLAILGKSVAVKAWIASHGALIYSKLGFDGVLYATIGLSGIIGTAVALNKVPEKAKNGFRLLFDGINKKKASKVMEGFVELTSSYTTMSGFSDDMAKIIDDIGLATSVEISIKKQSMPSAINSNWQP